MPNEYHWTAVIVCSELRHIEIIYTMSISAIERDSSEYVHFLLIFLWDFITPILFTKQLGNTCKWQIGFNPLLAWLAKVFQYFTEKESLGNFIMFNL